MDLSQRQLDILAAMPLNRAVLQSDVLPMVNRAIEWRWSQKPDCDRTKRPCLARNLAPSLRWWPTVQGLNAIRRSVRRHQIDPQPTDPRQWHRVRVFNGQAGAISRINHKENTARVHYAVEHWDGATTDVEIECPLINLELANNANNDTGAGKIRRRSYSQ